MKPRAATQPDAAAIRCVLYLRSSKDGADISPETQEAELRALALNKRYAVVHVFSNDKPVSANDNPPQLAAMLKEFKNPRRGWTVVLAVDSSRIARDMNLAGVIAYEARKAGCRIEYSKMPSSGNAAMDMMIEANVRAWDQYHSMISKEKGIAGMKTNVANGHRAGGSAPLGYALEHKGTGVIRRGEEVVKSKLVLDPAWARKVKQYLELRGRRVSRAEAARKSGLAEKNITTLIGIERNALTYAGMTVWNRGTDRKQQGAPRYRPREEWVVQRGTHEALIDEKTAEALMQRALPRPERRTRGPSGEFLLSGFLFTPQGQALVSSGDNYYRAGKGRRIPAATLEAVVLSQANEEADSHEFMAKFMAEAKRTAADIVSGPAALEAERKRVNKQLATWLQLAEKAPESPTLIARLRELEAERARLDDALRHAKEDTQLKTWLANLKPEEARAALADWRVQDGSTTEEKRSALAQIVDRIEFDPTTGEGRIHYRVPFNGAKFDLRAAARELGISNSGVLLATPRGTTLDASLGKLDWEWRVPRPERACSRPSA